MEQDPAGFGPLGTDLGIRNAGSVTWWNNDGTKWNKKNVVSFQGENAKKPITRPFFPLLYQLEQLEQ